MDFILLRSEASRKAGAVQPTLPALRNSLRNLIQNLSLLREGRAAASGNDGVHLGIAPEVCSLGRSSMGQRDYAAKAATWEIAQPETIAPLLTPLKQLQHLGTTVVLLDIPPSPAAVRLQPASLKHEVMLQRQHLESDLQALFWSPGALPDSDYCDLGHLNDDGRERYSGWLATQIIAWQASRH